MLRFALRQIGRFALLMVLVSMATFALVSAAPIDPLQANVGQAALLGMSEEKRAALASYWGAGAPPLERYGLREVIPYLPLLSGTAFLLMLHRVQSLHIRDFLRSDIPICA